MLLKLNILLQNENSQYHMNPTFQTGLHSALTLDGNNSSFGMPPESAPTDKHKVEIYFLNQYAHDSWEAVLHYLVGTPSDKRPRAVMKLLEFSGLMNKVGESVHLDGSPNLVITNKGFQFLLQDTNVQVWGFLLQYLDMSNSLNMDPVEVLNFLFQLGSLELGQDYSVTPLTLTQQHMLDDLKHLGIVYQRKKKSSRFYPTCLATSLTSHSSAEDKKGYIIVETNYRVYAYTSSPLQIAILSLFIDLKARFPNMVTGSITRDRIREALDKGITSDQIISYLTTHAHPEMLNNNPVLPQTVIDQLKLWDMERNRLKITLGYLYQLFLRQEDYEEVKTYANDLGGLVWANEKKRMLYVTTNAHEQVREYVKRKIARQQNVAS